MLTPSQILRSIESREFRRLIDRLLTNGRCHSQHARRLLQQPAGIEAVAIGLALQRIGELAYWAVPEGSDLAHRLMRLQRHDGSFSDVACEQHDASHVAATAIALRGLVHWRTAFTHREDEAALLDRAITRGFRALSSSLAESHDISEIALAVVVWQLGDCELAGTHLPMSDLQSRLASAESVFLRDDLPRLALTLAA